MPSQALSRSTPVRASAARTAPRAFNPSSYRAEALELMEANPKLAAQAQTQLASNYRAAERDLNAAEESTQDIIAFLASTALVAAIGMWDGTVMAKRDSIIELFEANGLIKEDEEPPRELWKAQGIKEPGRLWIFPTQLIVPILLGAGAVAAAASREENDQASTLERVLAVSATTTFGLWVAGITRAAGFRMQQKKMIAAGTWAAIQATGT